LRLPSSLKPRNYGLLNVAFSELPLKTEVFRDSLYKEKQIFFHIILSYRQNGLTFLSVSIIL
ncbi:MAG TPA: hypothetical protein DEO40_00510, partial [Treponema sp.]|nr:hypothetical protein [Treponema sp.]